MATRVGWGLIGVSLLGMGGLFAVGRTAGRETGSGPANPALEAVADTAATSPPLGDPAGTPRQAGDPVGTAPGTRFSEGGASRELRSRAPRPEPLPRSSAERSYGPGASGAAEIPLL